MQEIRKCEYCGKEFVAKNSTHRYCSCSCRDKNRPLTQIQVKCLTCGKEYIVESKNRGQKERNFCSLKCSYEYRKTHGNKKDCIICGKEFVSVKENHVCCSKSCQRKYTKLHTDKTCVVCGKIFHDMSNTMFCSDSCKHQYRLNQGELRSCKYCGNEFRALNGTHYFCTEQCKNMYYNDHPEYYKLTCSECGKIFLRNKKVKSQDGNVVFCSQTCKGNYYADHYRDGVLQRLKDGRYKTTMTAPHIIVSEYLKEAHIEYEDEYVVKPFSADIKLKNTNILIEIMGSYWHADIRKYNDKPLNSSQQNNVKRDIRKHQFLINNNYRILYLWEDDIMNNLDKCILLINEFIKGNNMTIHSSAYDINNNNLIENNIIQYIQQSTP